MEAECEMLLLAVLKCWKCWSRFLVWVSSLELRNQEVSEAGVVRTVTGQHQIPHRRAFTRLFNRD